MRNCKLEDLAKIVDDFSEEDFSEEPVESVEDTSEEDIKTITEKTNCTEEQAKESLKKAEGDLTEAILSLS